MEYQEFDREVVESIKEIDEKIKENNASENWDGAKATKLMYEQMLRGLYLTNPKRM